MSPSLLVLGCLFAVSLGLSLILTALARRLGRVVGLVDRPDGRRKVHGRDMPVAGGLAILAATVLTLGAAYCFDAALHDLFVQHAGVLCGLLLGALVICALGVADDYACLRGRHKLAGQVLAVGIVMSFGVNIRAVHFFEWNLELGILSIPFTLFWLLGAINALNLLDGMDGMLGTIGLIVCLAMTAVAGLHNQWTAALVAVTLAGAILGFLRYNYPPASIFLGDAGSMLIGLVIGALAIESSLKSPATVALATPTALLIIPILDTAAAIVRRKLTGRSIYSTDRGHLHHCLLRSGLSHHWALGVVSGLCLITVVGVVASLASSNETLAILSCVVVIALLLFTRLFGCAEVVLIQKHFAGLAASLLTRPLLDEARVVEVRLQGSADWKVVWDRLTEYALELDLVSLRLDVNAPALHEGYHARWDRPAHKVAEEHLWRTDMPLHLGGHLVGRLDITGIAGGEPVWEKIATVAKVLDDLDAFVDELPLPNGMPRLRAVGDETVIDVEDESPSVIEASPQVE